MGYSVPLDARAAYLAGDVLQASALDWRSGDFPRWAPLPGGSVGVGNSSLRDAGQGLFARAPITKGSVLPPYQGFILSRADMTRAEYVKSDMNYVWCPRSSAFWLQETDAEEQPGLSALEPTFCVDSELSVRGNPARFVNGARTAAQCMQVNMEICELGDVAYFRTTRDIDPGSEMLIDYGPRYWSDFGGC